MDTDHFKPQTLLCLVGATLFLSAWAYGAGSNAPYFKCLRDLTLANAPLVVVFSSDGGVMYVPSDMAKKHQAALIFTDSQTYILKTRIDPGGPHRTVASIDKGLVSHNFLKISVDSSHGKQDYVLDIVKTGIVPTQVQEVLAPNELVNGKARVKMSEQKDQLVQPKDSTLKSYQMGPQALQRMIQRAAAAMGHLASKAATRGPTASDAEDSLEMLQAYENALHGCSIPPEDRATQATIDANLTKLRVAISAVDPEAQEASVPQAIDPGL